MKQRVGHMVRSKVEKSKQMPKWALLRLATLTGKPPGFWKVLALSAVTGAVASICVLLVGRSVLRSEGAEIVPGRSRSLNSGESR